MTTATLPRPTLQARTTPSSRPGAAPQTPSTPARRDRFLDMVRVVAIALVVLQHWTLPVLGYDSPSGVLTAGNAFTMGWARVLTWVTQVMPLVFFVGGAAHAHSLGRRRSGPGDGGWGTWVPARLRRLLRPVVPLAVAGVVAPHLLLDLGVPEQPVLVGAHVAGQLLWFLATYVLVVALAPWLEALGRRHGIRVTVALVAAAAVVDVARLVSGVEAVGYLDVAFVWLALHQLGIDHVAGRLPDPRLLAVGGYAAAALLVATGAYPVSMVGMPGEPSNVAPPSLALLAVGIGQVGLVLLARRRAARWAERPAVAAVLDWCSARMMTVYLWHMPALVVVSGVVVAGLGVDTPAPGSVGWWLGWPLWLALLAGALLTIGRRVVGVELSGAHAAGTPLRGRAGTVAASAALALGGGGLLALTVNGFRPGALAVLGAAGVILGQAVAGLPDRGGRQGVGRRGGVEVGIGPARRNTVNGPSEAVAQELPWGHGHGWAS